MPISCDEFFEGVKSISNDIELNTPASEFLYRNYCSRSYYAIFNFILLYLNENHDFDNVINNGSYSNIGSHKRVTEFISDLSEEYSNNKKKLYKSLVYRIKYLKQNRVTADYYFDNVVDQLMMKQSESQLKGIIDLVNDLNHP